MNEGFISISNHFPFIAKGLITDKYIFRIECMDLSELQKHL